MFEEDREYFEKIFSDLNPTDRLFRIRENYMENAKDFLESHADESGNLSAKDKKAFDEMEWEIKQMTREIKKELSKPTREPILNNPQNNGFNNFSVKSYSALGVSGKDYHEKFFAQFRNGGFRNGNVQNILQESTNADGGYLLPVEMHDEIVAELREENCLRQISRVIQTSSKHELPILATRPQAAFVAEGATIPISNETFDRKTLGAYKLAVGVSVSNELLQDSAYNLEQHLVTEFAGALASAEENAFLNGSGVNSPTGILTTINGDSTMTVTSASANLTSDDLVNLVYSLKRPYRKNAVFLMNDSTLAEVRKLKDTTLNFIFQQGLTEGEPSRLLGFPIFTSEFLPTIASGALPILFGDFTKFIIGQRGEMTFKPLRELNALQDLTSFLMITRIDGVLSDTQAIKALKMK